MCTQSRCRPTHVFVMIKCSVGTECAAGADGSLHERKPDGGSASRLSEVPPEERSKGELSHRRSAPGSTHQSSETGLWSSSIIKHAAVNHLGHDPQRPGNLNQLILTLCWSQERSEPATSGINRGCIRQHKANLRQRLEIGGACVCVCVHRQTL